MPEVLDHYSSWEIAEVIDRTLPFRPYFLEDFGMVYTTDKKSIDFEEVANDERISPFVSPVVKGRVARKLGGEVNTYKPGYIKDKEVIEPNGHQVRRVGEQPNGSATPAQRLQAAMVTSGNAIQMRYLRRMEVMASQLTINGKYTMTGEQFPAVLVDFQRPAGNTLNLPAGSRWGETGVSPVDDIDAMLDNLEYPCRRITLGKNAATKLKADPKFDKLIDRQLNFLEGTSTIQGAPQQQNRNRVTLLGRFGAGGIEIWVNNATYTDNDGTQKRYVGTDQCVFHTMPEFGYRCHAVIQDIHADLGVYEQFWRAWTETGDPANHYIMMQAAPMLATTAAHSTAVINTAG